MVQCLPILKSCASVITASSFHIIVEGQMMCKVTEFTEAVPLMFALFYVFNISYPKELASTLHYLQKYVFAIDDGTSSNKVAKLRMSLFSR